MKSPIVALKGVQKYYGDYHALRDISLEIAEGEFFSLLGPSGCGKTTLLRAIAGFESVSEGTLHLDGRDVRGVPPNRRPTNMVFQSYAIFPHLSVAENVGFGLRRRGDLNATAKRALVEDALDMVGLDGYGGRAAHALSGGQRQRVALARALILKPRVLLLDEPLSALDKKLRETMQAELRRLQRHVGITFVLVTHDQEEALIMSDRIAVMFEGRIAQVAGPQALYRRPADRRVAEFIGMMSFLPATASGTRVEVAGLGTAEVAPDQAPGGLADGAAEVGIRPELLTLVQGGESRPHTAPGTVAEVHYYGDMTYYEVAFDGVDRPVTISMKNLPGRPVLERGQAAIVGWDPRGWVVFGQS
ncbi:ABC transporter ATP-binding protein [Rhodobacteraceae bacterium CCMM004]|nr:ABC transporter ATP-binding protein [Rhodobacteraceae bacterium CCMM004]